MPAPKAPEPKPAPAKPEGRKPWKKKTPVEVVLEQADKLKAEIAEAEDRIDLAHLDLEPSAGGIEVDGDPAAQEEAVGELLAGGGKRPAHPAELSFPDDRVETPGNPALLTRLDQIEIEMARAREPRFLYLARHPDRLERRSEQRLDLAPELGDRVGGFEARQGHGRGGYWNDFSSLAEARGKVSAHSCAFRSPGCRRSRKAAASLRLEKRRQMKVCPAGAVK